MSYIFTLLIVIVFCLQLTKFSFIFEELNANDLLDILQALIIFNLFCVKTCFWRVHFLNSHLTIQCTLARQAIFLGHPVCCYTEEYFRISIHIQFQERKKKNGRLLSLQISNIKVLNEGGLISERFFTMAKISKKKKKGCQITT